MPAIVRHQQYIDVEAGTLQRLDDAPPMCTSESGLDLLGVVGAVEAFLGLVEAVVICEEAKALQATKRVPTED